MILAFSGVHILLMRCAMSRYRRSLIPGGTYFFTVALANRQSTLLVDEVLHFKRAFIRSIKNRCQWLRMARATQQA